jgi:hypothetical protein
MRIVVDNEPLTAAPGNIAAALSAARLNAEQRGRVVIEALLDGEPLTDAQLSDPSTAPRNSGEMRFTTAEPAELVGSTLIGVAETLTDVKQEQQAAAELLTLGKMSEAMDRLHHALRTWEGVRQAVIDGTKLLGMSVETTRVRTTSGERAMSEQVRLLATSLGEVKRAFGAEDWSGLADVLGYDMQEQADQWRETLLALAELIRTTRTLTPGGDSDPSGNPDAPPKA